MIDSSEAKLEPQLTETTALMSLLSRTKNVDICTRKKHVSVATGDRLTALAKDRLTDGHTPSSLVRCAGPSEI